jgi:hypothetical protein
MTRNKFQKVILLVGTLWFTGSALMLLALLLFGGSQNRQGGPPKDVEGRLMELFHWPLVFLAITVIAVFPVGIWFRLYRRSLIAKRLTAEPSVHGKYLSWGRNLRRQASIPARYSGLRPRKAFRARREEEG